MTEPSEGRDLAFAHLSVPRAYEETMGLVMFEPWGQALVDYAGIEKSATVLDIACGTGIVTRLAAVRAGPRGHVLGIDISDPMLSVARAKPDLEGAAPIDYLEGSAFSLPVPDGSYDVVLCHQGLPFLPDRAAALREMHRVAKPGGTVAVAVWSSEHPLGMFGPMVEALAKISPEPPFPNAYNPQSFSMTVDALRQAYLAAGFAEVKVDTRERDVVFDSMDAALRTVHGTPYGPLTTKLPAERQAALREAMIEGWKPGLDERGRVHMRTVAHLARART